MSIPYEIPIPTTKNINRAVKWVQDKIVAQTSEEPRESYTAGDRADHNAEKADNARVKDFVLKHRAQGQNVGLTKGPDGRLKAGWVKDPTSKQVNSYWNSSQHRADAVEFLKGGAESVGSFVKSQADSTPVMQAKRLILDPFGEYEKQQQQSQAIQEGIRNPRKAFEGLKNQMHERYVAPIERGDMRGAGRAGGDILVTVAEGVTTKKILGPTAGFRPNKGVSKSSHNGGAGKSGSWKSSGKSGSKPGGAGGPGGTGKSGSVKSNKKKKAKKTAKFDISPSQYPTAKYEVGKASKPKGRTVEVKPDKMPGDTFTHKFVHQPVKVDRSLKMRSMSEFLSDAPLGRMLRGSAERTGKTYQSVPIYRMSKKMQIGDVVLNKGDHFYLDKLHGDHIEVFNRRGKVRDVLDLGGNQMREKFERAKNEGRNIKDLVSHVETSHALA